MPLTTSRWSAAALAAAALALLFAGAIVLWVSLDRLPPNWDDAWYLTNSLTVYDGFTSGGVLGGLAKLNSAFGFKAPLIAAFPAPFYLLLGRRWHAAFFVNAVCLLVLCWVLYRLAAEWSSSRAGLFAIPLVCGMPLLYGLSHWYLVEYPLTALLALALWLLVDSGDLTRRSRVLAFGLACGAGMLLKVSFAAFVLPAFLYYLVRAQRRLRAVLLASAGLLLAAPWYVTHLRPVLANALDAGFGQPAAVQGTGPIFSFGAVATYLARVAVNGISLYEVALCFLLAIWIAWRRGWPGKPSAVLLLWMLPFVLFLFGGNKDIRYIAPILPAFALLTALLLDFALPRNLVGAGLAALLLAFPVVQMSAVSFGVPYLAGELTYARHFNLDAWPLDRIVKAIAADATVRPGEKSMVLVGSDVAALNANNLELTVTALQLPFLVETTAHEKSFDTLRQRLSEAAYFVYKEGGEPEATAFNPYIGELVRLAARSAAYGEIFSVPVHGGGIVRVLKNSGAHPSALESSFTRSTAPAKDDLRIDFGGVLSLAQASSSTALNSITVHFRWRCLRPPGRDYWCFTHAIDAQNKIVAQLDHRLLGGNPPLLSWQAGDSGDEEIHLQLPAGASPAGLRLRFGLYDPPSGERLQIAPLQGAAASKFTLIDAATALLMPD